MIGAALLCAALAAAPAAGQSTPVDARRVLDEVAFAQRLGEQVPLDAAFRDHTGRSVRLGELLGDGPVLLALVYYECPMLCTEVLNGLLRCARALPLDAGRDYRIVAVSIDPGETPELAARKREALVAGYGRAGGEDGWSLLVGDEPQIRALADAVGFRYVYDAANDEYAHAAGLVALTPEGRASHYFYGLEYAPRDVRLGLVEAAGGAIGSAVDQVLLFCFHYDPVTGRYGLVIMNVLRLAGVLTVALVGGFVAVMLRRERRARRLSGAGSAA